MTLKLQSILYVLIVICGTLMQIFGPPSFFPEWLNDGISSDLSLF